jgi:hypothetical protein
MSILKSALTVLVAGGALVAISSTAFAATPTPAGPLTIMLVCDTGPAGSGTFTVTANGKSSTVLVKCGKSATVTNAAWMTGSMAVIHQTVTPSGALRARDITITLKATAQTAVIRDFRPASTSAATLAQTGGSPALPVGLGLLGLILVGLGARTLFRQRNRPRTEAARD